MVNRKSIEALTKEICDRYNDQPQLFSKINFNEIIFRPNLVIDTEVPYEEEEFQ